MPSAIDPVINGVTNLSISFPYSGITISSQSFATVDLIQRANMHDVAIITIPNMNVVQATEMLVYGAPVRISWNAQGGTGLFTGYVHSPESQVTERSNSVRVIAVSAGFPLKRRSQRLWTNITASAVAAELAAQHGLNYDIETHPRIFPQITQHGCSDWELLRDLAERVGFSLRVEGVTLQFCSHSRLARHYRSIAPKVKISPQDSRKGSALREMIRFTPMLSENSTDGESVSANHVMTILDAASGKVLSAISSEVEDSGRNSSAPLHERFSTRSTARNSTDANHIVKAASENNRYPIRAMGTMLGTPYLEPNRCLQISGMGQKVDGYWSVLEARHSLSGGANYTVDLILGAEGLGAERFQPSGSSDTLTALPGPGLLKVPYPQARLTQGQWGITAPRGVASFEEGPRWVPA